MASPPPPPTATSSALFDSQTRGSLSHRTIIIIASTLSASLVFTISLAIIHILRKQRRRTKAQTKQQTDIETSLQRAQPPVLTIDTNVQSIPEPQRSAQGPQLKSVLARDIPPIPRIYINEPSLPPIEQHMPMTPIAMWATHPNLGLGTSPMRNASIPAAVAARSPTRNASLPPGIGGRNTEHVRGKHLARDGSVYDTHGLLRPVMPELPAQVWDPRERKVVVLR